MSVTYAVKDFVPIYQCSESDGSLLLNLADINECYEQSYDCHQNANCSNTDGGYECHCSGGYTGNGTECEGSLLGLFIAIKHIIFDSYYGYLHQLLHWVKLIQWV